jgi:hypothetical protein
MQGFLIGVNQMNPQLVQFLVACKAQLDYYESLEKSYFNAKQSWIGWCFSSLVYIFLIAPPCACLIGYLSKLVFVGDYIIGVIGQQNYVYVLVVLSAVLIGIYRYKKRQYDNSTVNSVKKIFSSPEYYSFYQQVSSVLGEKYCTAHACGKFLEYISSGRCADLMMAKNIYEQELAQERLEQTIRDRISADLATEQREQREQAEREAEEQMRQNEYQRQLNMNR